MAFSTCRGRPRTKPDATDPGTPELRLKNALGLTCEPIDACFNRKLITADQHWCGLHLRWLYTVRYGAPVLTTRYAGTEYGPNTDESREEWRIAREHEYHEAIALLKQTRRYECVMRLCVFNEQPAFLKQRLRERAWHEPALAHQLARAHRMLDEGLTLLVKHWKKPRQDA